MFNIPKHYQMDDLSFEMAERILKGSNTSGITMMENVKEKWDLHCSGHHFFEDDEQFFECWMYEVNAYNVMYNEMKPLLAGEG